MMGTRESCPCGDGLRPGHPATWCGQGAVARVPALILPPSATELVEQEPEETPVERMLREEFRQAVTAEAQGNAARIRWGARLAAMMVPRLAQVFAGLDGDDTPPEFMVGRRRGRVALEFGTPLTGMALEPGEARELARLLVHQADKIDPQDRDR